MERMKLRIADIYIDLESENTFFNDICKPFIVDDNQKCSLDGNNVTDMKLSIRYTDHITVPGDEKLVEGESDWLKKPGDKAGYYMYQMDATNKKVMIMLESNDDWSDVKICCLDSGLNWVDLDTGIPAPYRWEHYYTYIIAGSAYNKCLVRKQGFAFHSSAISYKGMGIAFTAPSGTGKSTQARLWKELYGDDVIYINDDNPIIRIIDGKPYAYGTPWSGTSDIFINMGVPLKAIVRLEQAGQNSIERVEVEKVLEKLLSACNLPYFDEGMMDKALDTLDRIFCEIPVYLLKCLPEAAAVELACDYIFEGCEA